MGSACETAIETVNYLNARDENVGVLEVRLFQPFDGSRLAAALPASARTIAVLDRCKEPGTAGEPLYLCGPKPMIDTAIQTAKDLGWADGRLRFEIFATPTPVAGDQTFEVVLNNSGKTFRIPPDKTILGVLIEAGEDPMHDCQRGDCGICQVSVIEGTPDHRDYILTDAEKAEGKVMQICVSRSKSPRLVLDL